MVECPICGYRNSDRAESCENCGQSLLKTALNANWPNGGVAVQRPTSQNVSDHFSGNFVAPDETVRAAIGISFMQNFLSGAGFKNGAAILTDKRLYYFGRSFSNVGKGMNTATEEGIISVGDITFTRFVHGSPLWYLILAIVFTLPGVMLFTLSFGSTDDFAGVFGTVGLLFALSGIILFVAYFVGRSTVLEISFPGGKYCFDARWHSKADMKEFQRQIHLVKDSLKASRCSESNREGPHDE